MLDGLLKEFEDMDKIRMLLGDKKAVSPVIGEILMVAVAVILAALLAAFVFGVIDVPETTPQASINVQSHSIKENSVVLLHQSGNEIDMNNLRVIVENETDSWTFLNESETKWQPGYTKTLKRNNGDLTNHSFELELHNTYEIRIIYIPSGNLISSTTFVTN